MPNRWTIWIHPHVVSVIYQTPRTVVSVMWAVVNELEKDPYHPDSQPVPGESDVFSITVDGYRLVYQVVQHERVLRIIQLHIP